MRVLYLTHPKEDYLQDQILIGLRRLLGTDCVDYPRKEVLYTDCERPSSDLYGRGFTIWKTLSPLNIDRSTALDDVRRGTFDFVVFGSIWRQSDRFRQFEENGLLSVDGTRYVFLDGEDCPYTPPGLGLTTKNVVKKILPGYSPRPKHKYEFNGLPYTTDHPVCTPALTYGAYLKRELDSHLLHDAADTPILPISFSIPGEKIRSAPQSKSRLYQSHVQCEEAYKVEEVQQHSTPEPLFTEEQSYYDDLASAKYGITQKKAGWECMRHYEIAANLTVPCFYKLSKKPFLTAPHGLQDMHNCITFQSAEQLQAKVEYVERRGFYDHLLSNVNTWVRERTCKAVARRLLIRTGFSSAVQNGAAT